MIYASVVVAGRGGGWGWGHFLWSNWFKMCGTHSNDHLPVLNGHLLMAHLVGVWKRVH